MEGPEKQSTPAKSSGQDGRDALVADNTLGETTAQQPETQQEQVPSTERSAQTSKVDLEQQIDAVASDAPYSVLPRGEKAFVIMAGSFAALISPLSSSIYLPVLTSLAHDMEVSISSINLTITTYLVRSEASNLGAPTWILLRQRRSFKV